MSEVWNTVLKYIGFNSLDKKIETERAQETEQIKEDETIQQDKEQFDVKLGELIREVNTTYITEKEKVSSSLKLALAKTLKYAEFMPLDEVILSKEELDLLGPSFMSKFSEKICELVGLRRNSVAKYLENLKNKANDYALLKGKEKADFFDLIAKSKEDFCAKLRTGFHRDSEVIEKMLHTMEEKDLEMINLNRPMGDRPRFLPNKNEKF